MDIVRKAVAGTLESSDVLVEIGPGEGGVLLEVQSAVEDQFGDAIRETVLDVLARFGVGNARVALRDRGALDWTLRARIETAVLRGAAEH